MEELLDEVKKIIHVYNLNLKRQKKFYDYPFTNNCNHYYRLMMIQGSIEIWENCRALLEKYQNKRWGQIERHRSLEFESKMNLEIKDFPGAITQRTRQDMIEYMRKLEWKVEQLEGEYNGLKTKKNIM